MSEKKIPILDFDALIDAIEALSAPNALDVAISNTGMHVITEDEVQGALTEVDTALYNINSSLAQLPLIQRGCKKSVSLSANSQTEVSITLDTPILTDYVVSTEIVFYGSANTFSKIVRDRGQSSFTLRVYNSNNVAVTVEIDWMAIPV